MNARLLILSITAFLQVHAFVPQNIFWDLGDTLIETKKMQVANQIGLGDFIGYTLFDWHNPKKLESHLFAFLGSLKPHDRDMRYVPTNNGQPMPALMCDWQEGKIAPDELLKISKKAIAEYDKKSYFISSRHRRLIEGTISFMFDPIALGSSFKLIKNAVKLLDEVAQIKTRDSKKHTLYIISNFESKAFDALARTNEGRKLLSYFDPVRVVISGKIGMVKPHPDIFHYMLKTYNLNPTNCVLIDNEKINVDRAKEVGMRGIIFDPSHRKTMRKQFVEHKLLD